MGCCCSAEENHARPPQWTGAPHHAGEYHQQPAPSFIETLHASHDSHPSTLTHGGSASSRYYSAAPQRGILPANSGDASSGRPTSRRPSPSSSRTTSSRSLFSSEAVPPQNSASPYNPAGRRDHSTRLHASGNLSVATPPPPPPCAVEMSSARGLSHGSSAGKPSLEAMTGGGSSTTGPYFSDRRHPFSGAPPAMHGSSSWKPTGGGGLSGQPPYAPRSSTWSSGSYAKGPYARQPPPPLPSGTNDLVAPLGGPFLRRSAGSGGSHGTDTNPSASVPSLPPPCASKLVSIPVKEHPPAPRRVVAHRVNRHPTDDRSEGSLFRRQSSLQRIVDSAPAVPINPNAKKYPKAFKNTEKIFDGKKPRYEYPAVANFPYGDQNSKGKMKGKNGDEVRKRSDLAGHSRIITDEDKVVEGLVNHPFVKEGHSNFFERTERIYDDDPTYDPKDPRHAHSSA